MGENARSGGRDTAVCHQDAVVLVDVWCIRRPPDPALFSSLHRFYAFVAGLAGLLGGALVFAGFIDLTPILRTTLGALSIAVGYVFIRIALSKPRV